ncbi:MAG: aminotransferase class V-fold PLP-dependent enzyme [Gammaproteobacteria bacterium]|nr:aminotransferase class V-fold PLP-dependent enzyme [Gammaproteobacteria bacterium]
MNMTRSIYLDNNATTALAPAALDAMLPYLSTEYANPSSASEAGVSVKKALGEARVAVAKLLGASPAELIFTSGATESNHTAILGALSLTKGKRHLITSQVEHPSVLLMCQHLERLGIEVSYLPVDEEGRLDLEDLRVALRPDTALVSLMWANNETGVLFPITEAAAMAHDAGAFFHTDATQALGKLSVNAAASGVDFLSCSAHKIHGPKGVGALFVRKGIALPPLFHGHQERGRRGGTENVPAIAGFAAAARLLTNIEHEAHYLRELRDHFEQGLLAFMPCARIHGQEAERLPNTSNVGFIALDSEELLYRLEQEGITAAAGAACAAGGQEPSHVLTAMGFSKTAVLSSLRFSFGRMNRSEDVERLLRVLPGILLGMMDMPPVKAGTPISCTP